MASNKVKDTVAVVFILLCMWVSIGTACLIYLTNIRGV